MELTTTITLTEGMVYNAMKEAIQEFFTNLPSQTDSKTTCPTSRLWGQILRNGKPVTDSDIEPVKDKSLGETKYGVVLLRGAKEIGTIEM